jgi:hypothetical protein
MNNGNKNRSVGKVLTGSVADVYTVPAAFKADVESIVIVNTSNNIVKVDLNWYQATTTTSYALANDVSLLPNSLLQMTNPLFLDKNDKITGSAAVADVITVSVRVREYFAERL